MAQKSLLSFVFNTQSGFSLLIPSFTVVSYAPIPENISPTIIGERKAITDDEEEYFGLDRPRQYRASCTRRLSGRPARITESPLSMPLTEDRTSETQPHSRDSTVATQFRYRWQSNFLEQVTAWLEEEKAKSQARRAERHAADLGDLSISKDEKHKLPFERRRTSSNASDGALALEKLEKIIEQALALAPIPKPLSRKTSRHSHKTSSYRKLKHHPASLSSDTDFQDGELFVPSCEAWLEDTRISSHFNGTTDFPEASDRNTPDTKDLEALNTFKFEILRLTHTLRVKEWRRIPLASSNEIYIERLSGALTNSVYVISPPKDLSTVRQTPEHGVPRPKKPPP